MLAFALPVSSSETAVGKASEYTPVPMDVPDGFSVAAVGDMILQHPQSSRPALAGLLQFLKADVTFGNFANTTSTWSAD